MLFFFVFTISSLKIKSDLKSHQFQLNAFSEIQNRSRLGVGFVCFLVSVAKPNVFKKYASTLFVRRLSPICVIDLINNLLLPEEPEEGPRPLEQSIALRVGRDDHLVQQLLHVGPLALLHHPDLLVEHLAG